MNRTVRAAIEGGDEVEIQAQIQNEQVMSLQWKVIGNLDLYQEIEKIKAKLRGNVKELPVPQGRSPAQLLLKEAILKLKGQWGEEPSDPELCHCRKIPQTHVERAIILGAHTPDQIRQKTTANTGCGTCLPDIEQLLEKYLK